MPATACLDLKQICLDLVRADDESHVTQILTDSGLADPGLWVPLGGIENNLSIVGNQQSCATASLVEKLVNSTDSLLLLECRRRGIDPESPNAPPTMRAATSEFFNVPEGNVARLRPADRGRLAEQVYLVATGSKRDPSFTVLDRGEGQRPIDFPATFCSLVRSNKLRTPFVQGKFNMGGCGTLPFCGERNYQLILSRRHPDLVGDATSIDVNGWGWTIIRRRNPGEGVKSSSYEYLAPNSSVPCFPGEPLSLCPSRGDAYALPLASGTLIKLYNYQIEYRSTIVFDLNFELSRRLYQLALPIRLCERRDYRGHSRDTILTGMSVRLEDDRAGVIETGFPDSGIVHVPNVGDIPVEVMVFKKGLGRNFLHPQASILFTVNGQTHGTIGRRFCSRSTVGLDFLKNDLMVVVNSTDIPPRTREDLFMPSRDRLRECAAKRAIEQALEAYLHDHEELIRLNRLRREEELAGRLADDQPLSDALRAVINDSPELRQLFGSGIHLPVPSQPGVNRQPFQGVRFPTFFRLAGIHSSPTPELDCPLGGVTRVQFDTDAENEYFTRQADAGTIVVQPDGLFGRVHLRDGQATVTLACPHNATVGTTVDVAISVTDPSRTQPFVRRLRLKIVEKPERTNGGENERRPRSGALALPKIVEVEESGWEAEEFDPESGLAIQRDIDGGIVAKVNVANEHLRQSLLRTVDTDRELMKKRFVYGLVLAGVSLWREYGEQENGDDAIRTATKAIARVLLPTILVLGRLEADIMQPA